MERKPLMTAEQALNRLKEGNDRFVSNVRSLDVLLSQMNRPGEVRDQQPLAVILGCSDSRVPAEIIFDQGLGELFVIRVAGNIVAPSQIGSVEFSVGQYNTPLVVVLGHSRCGAVRASLDHMAHPEERQSANMLAIVQRIRPSLIELFDSKLREDPEELLSRAVRANVRASVNQLRHGSPLLEKAVYENRLLIVGAEYSLEKGEVIYFDGVPDDAGSTSQ